jgi:hypothetical protein
MRFELLTTSYIEFVFLWYKFLVEPPNMLKIANSSETLIPYLPDYTALRPGKL